MHYSQDAVVVPYSPTYLISGSEAVSDDLSALPMEEQNLGMYTFNRAPANPEPRQENFSGLARSLVPHGRARVSVYVPAIYYCPLAWIAWRHTAHKVFKVGPFANSSQAEQFPEFGIDRVSDPRSESGIVLGRVALI